MSANQPRAHVIQGDCQDVLKGFSADSVSCVITDPPYNYEFIGREWDHDEIRRRIERLDDSSSTLVRHIPYGSGLAGGVRNARWYARNRQNVLDYSAWCRAWGQELFRICKAGAFAALFSSTRTLAHVQIALEEAGFYTRDVLVYRRHAGIPKGLNIGKKLAKQGHPAAPAWEGWHTCLRNEWEAIVLVQKPLIDNYLTTLAATGLGPLRAIREDGSFQSNILEGFPRDTPSAEALHCTPKPLALIRHLIALLVPPGGDHLILDPFAGTGTTLVAALEAGHRSCGIEIEARYCAVIRRRLAEAQGQPASPAPQSGSHPVAQLSLPIL